MPDVVRLGGRGNSYTDILIDSDIDSYKGFRAGGKLKWKN